MLIKPFGFFGGSSPFIVATGGTITTSGSYQVHTFTNNGTFEIVSPGTGTAAFYDYLVVGGGEGGRSANNAGDGGASGVSRLVTGSAAAVNQYTIVIGSGGTGGLNGFGNAGQITSAFTTSATGGGSATPGRNADFTSGGSPTEADAGLGGAGAGGDGSQSNGGNGITTTFSGATISYGGGGFGGRRNANPVYGPGAFGGGAGGNFTTNGGNATGYGGGGGGSCYSTRQGGSGADGVVIIKYRIQ